MERMMKRIAVIVALIFGLSSVGPASASAGWYEWAGINDEPLTLPGGRDLNLRMAMQVYYNSSGTPETVRTYLAVTCYRYGAVYPCSFNWRSSLNTDAIDYQEGTVTNTGPDGFASIYGSWRRVSGCTPYHSFGVVYDIGLAGYHYPPNWTARSGTWSKCT